MFTVSLILELHGDIDIYLRHCWSCQRPKFGIEGVGNHHGLNDVTLLQVGVHLFLGSHFKLVKFRIKLLNTFHFTRITFQMFTKCNQGNCHFSKVYLTKFSAMFSKNNLLNGPKINRNLQKAPHSNWRFFEKLKYYCYSRMKLFWDIFRVWFY